MKQKNIFLFMSMMCIFALTGCMKFVFNNGIPVSNPNVSTQNDVASKSNIQINNSSSIRYNQLNDVQKLVYNEIYIGIQNYSGSINISYDIKESDLEKIYSAIINTADFELVYPTRKYDFKYDSITGNIYKICPKYDISLETRSKMMDMVDETVNKIVAQTNNMTDFETVKLFHDYIITNCSYDMDGDNYSNAYGALIEGKAVCEGYARAFKYLCDKVDIPCELVIGQTDIEHMWNLVQIEGKWYNIDVTWDDPKNKDGDYISYSYFNLTDEQISIDHTVQDDAIFPVANSTDMNYFVYYNLSASSIEELYNLIYEQVYKACINDEKYIYVKVTTKDIYDEALSILSDGDWNVLYNIIKNASNSADVQLDNKEFTCSYDKDMLTFTINLS